MARRKDLGSLAALAGLAYMASRDKEGKGPAPSAPSAAPTAASADTGGDFIEAGSGPSGDFMSEKEPGWESGTAPASKPAAAKAKPVAAKTPSNPNYGNEGRRPIKEPSKLQYQSLQDRARTYEEERAKSGVGMYGSRKAKPREALPTAEDMAYKKGGSVKGWGIARGSRKAKTY
jgi:hypothetical protein